MEEVMAKSAEDPSLTGDGKQNAEGHPTREEIELRAYQIYVERGSAPGQDAEDWLQAERELIEKYGKSHRLAKANAV
jgi:hypothetical protein